MYRNWKNAAAVGLAVLLGCMMPMSTMLAAETGADSADSGAVYAGENASDSGNAADGECVPDDENVPDGGDVSEDGGVPDGESVSEGGGVSEDGGIPDGESVSEDGGVQDGGDVSEDGGVPDGGSVSEDGGVPDGEDVPEDGNADEILAADVLNVPMAEPDGAEEAEDAGSVSAPEIVIAINGKEITRNLGGRFAFEYIGYARPEFQFSAGQGDGTVSIYYYKETLTDADAEAKTEAQMDSLGWIKGAPGESLMLLQDGMYVVYVKAEVGEKKYYARSEGVVVDTRKPEIKGIEEGKTYPEGTPFQVEDANLDYVLVNETAAMPENGNYKVEANGTSCVIRAKDKVGNETVCGITVSGTATPEPEEPEKPDDSNVISKSGEYTLKAGVKYHLAAGKWKVGGDKSVYPGDSDFYVTADGSYKFTK